MTARQHYRGKKELPFELSQHVQTYYEENLFLQAYNFLLSITGNSVSSFNRLAPVTIPTHAHLALAATVAVHPVFSTRTISRDKWEQANAALRLLRLVHTTVGPVQANFVTAFSFRKYDFRFSRHNDSRAEDGDEDGAGEENLFDENDFNTRFARSQSLWTRAEDFWHLVGWAFNCACLPGIHAARWNHYRGLLEFMVDVLETDWQIRNRSSLPSPEESLIWQYIELAAGGHARARRILRAIFADGTHRSTSEFRPIFPHELKEAEREDGRIKKREVEVNIDLDIYGDYLAPDESEVSEDDDAASTTTGPGDRPSKRMRTRARTPSSRGMTPKTSGASLRSEYEAGEDSSPAPTLGEPACLILRLRLLRLLTYISSHPTLTSSSPTTFPDLEDLFTLFVEFIRPLPLSVFARIVLPSTQMFDAHTLCELSESLLQRILEHSAPSIRSHMLLSQTKLEKEYLPFAAGKNSVDANARVSILLESLTRSLAQMCVLKKTEALQTAVREGVERRTLKVTEIGEKKGRKGAKRDDADAWDWLLESGERLERVVDALES